MIWFMKTMVVLVRFSSIMISFNLLEIKPFTFKKRPLKKFLVDLIESEKLIVGDISISFVSDDYLLRMNQQYLKHDYFTDIITFDYRENDLVSGDLFISVDRLFENAAQNNCGFMNELHRVVFHGVLHLCGYKDKSRDDKVIMTEKENFYLSKYNV